MQEHGRQEEERERAGDLDDVVDPVVARRAQPADEELHEEDAEDVEDLHRGVVGPPRHDEDAERRRRGGRGRRSSSTSPSRAGTASGRPSSRRRRRRAARGSRPSRPTRCRRSSGGASAALLSIRWPIPRITSPGLQARLLGRAAGDEVAHEDPADRVRVGHDAVVGLRQEHVDDRQDARGAPP